MPSLRRLFLALTLLAGLAASSQADPGVEARPVVLPLAGGKTIEGVVESADAKEVVLRVGPEERRRIPWTQLGPLGVYRVRAALTPATDGARRRELAELAADLGLFAEARAEYEKALALGAVTPQDFETLVAAAEKAAVEQGVAVARRLADAGELAAALEVARGLKLGFGEAPNAPAIRVLIEDLLAQVRAQDDSAKQDAEDLAKAEAQARRQKEILERRARAEGAINSGDLAAKESAEARAKGNVTKARKGAEESLAQYTEARKNLGRLRRILPLDQAKARDEVAARLNDLDKKQFALCLAMAKFFAAPGARNFGKAEEWAAKAAYIDPVDPELLELRQRLVESRIRYRLSDVTNARPIVR
jgi:hypothetical protein